MMISLDRYRALLREPGLGAAVAASFVGRLPIGMAVLSILLFVQQSQQSFARAGIASALYVIGVGVAAPFIGRLIDRLGPRRLLRLCAVAYPLALGLFLHAVQSGASDVVIGAASFCAGAVAPPIPTTIRALLRRLLREPEHLQTAYSLDSVMMEMVFILGPGIVSVFTALVWPAGAVVCTAAFGLIGAWVFSSARAVKAWVPESGAHRPSRLDVLTTPGLPSVLTVTLFFSLGFGLFEVSVTAIASRAGSPAAAGVILALTSLGSAAVALVYGSRSWSWSVAAQYRAALAAMAIGLLLLAPIEHLVAFSLVSILAGVPMSTVLASQSVLIAGLAPRASLAECFTWSSTSLLVGVSAGIAVGGMALEYASPTAVLLAASATTAIGLGIAGRGVRPAAAGPLP
jgi:predicted MFS family arabinose efflux permease